MTPWITESDYQPGDGLENVPDRMRTMVRSLDLDHFSFLVLRGPDQQQFCTNDTLNTSYPDEWIDRYVALRYADVDPVATLTFKTFRPFFWGQGRFIRRFKKPQRMVFDEARAFHITYGLAIPIRGVNGEISVFNVVSSDKRHLHDVTRLAHTRILAAAYDTHDRILASQRPTRKDEENQVELSLRERECLSWTLEGKTAGEIATILGLSVSTVNQHASSASRKFGSLNKHHAAVKALRGGLIQ